LHYQLLIPDYVDEFIYGKLSSIGLSSIEDNASFVKGSTIEVDPEKYEDELDLIHSIDRDTVDKLKENDSTIVRPHDYGSITGTLIHWISPTASYSPRDYIGNQDEQVWIPSYSDSTKKPLYFVGLWLDDELVAEQLKRPQTIDGAIVEVLNSDSILIPEIRFFPTRIARTKNGNVENRVLDSFTDLFAESVIVFDSLVSWIKDGDQPEFDADWVNYVEKLVSVNYRVLPEVCDFLQWWDKNILLEIAAESVSLHPILDTEKQLKKKSTLDGEDT